MLIALLGGTTGAHAGLTPEQKCQKGRYQAAAKYDTCQRKLFAQFFGGDELYDPKFQTALSKCRVTYTATWATLQKAASGTGATCDAPRFVVNGDGTVTDHLTGLQWEQKTDDSTVHDRDNPYEWSTIGGTAASGSAFWFFLATLNSGGCFAGQCDWRLPTIAEVQTIFSKPYPCPLNPCIDQDLFGPLGSGVEWSSTTYATNPQIGWFVYYGLPGVLPGYKGNGYGVRAVRGGL
jgi:hypothetical protein